MAAAKVYGYAADNGRRITGAHDETIGTCRVLNSTKLRPGQPGAWISSERVSYRCKIDGQLYGCRGRGDGVAMSCRVLKNQKRNWRDGALGRRR